MKNGFELIKNFYSWVFNNQNGEVKCHHISLYMFLVNQNNRNNWVDWFKCPYDLGMAGSAINSKKTYYQALHQLEDWGLIKYQPGHANHKAPLISLVETGVNEAYTSVPRSEVLGFKNEPQHTPQHTPQQLPQVEPQQEPQEPWGNSSGSNMNPNSYPNIHPTVPPNSNTYKTYNHITNKPITDNIPPPVTDQKISPRYMVSPDQPDLEPPLNSPPDSSKKNQKAAPPEIPSLEEFMVYAKNWMEEHGKDYPGKRAQLISKYETWKTAGWKDGFGKPIKDWKGKIRNTEPHLKSDYAKPHTTTRQAAREPVTGKPFGSL